MNVSFPIPATPNPALQRTAALAFSYRSAAVRSTGSVTACAPAMKPGTCRAFASRRSAHTRASGLRSLSFEPFGDKMRLATILALSAFLCGCDSYKMRDMVNTTVGTSFPFDDCNIQYREAELTIFLEDKTKDLKNVEIDAKSCDLKDSAGHSYPLTIQTGRTSYKPRSSSDRLSSKDFYFVIQNPRYTKPDIGILPQGSYTLNFTLADRGFLIPVTVTFDLIDQWHKVPKMYQ